MRNRSSSLLASIALTASLVAGVAQAAPDEQWAPTADPPRLKSLLDRGSTMEPGTSAGAPIA